MFFFFFFFCKFSNIDTLWILISIVSAWQLSITLTQASSSYLRHINLVGQFVSSPREMKKRDTRDSRWLVISTKGWCIMNRKIDEGNDITKTCLFKYTENFTTKKWKYSDKKFWYFSYSCSKHRLWVLVRTAAAAVLTSTHSLCFWAEIRKKCIPL